MDQISKRVQANDAPGADGLSAVESMRGTLRFLDLALPSHARLPCKQGAADPIAFGDPANVPGLAEQETKQASKQGNKHKSKQATSPYQATDCERQS